MIIFKIKNMMMKMKVFMMSYKKIFNKIKRFNKMK
jgi:hypothetical protein